MKTYTIYQIDAFTKELFKGNPAGVVVNAEGLSENRMQQIARELNNSETSFLFPADDDSCDGVIRYFTPTTEVPTCGHATIAAMYAKAVEEKLDSCVLDYKTQIGVLPFEIIKTNDDFKISMTQGKVIIDPPLEDSICSELLVALGLTSKDLDRSCPIQIASTGHSKVMIGIRERNTLLQLDPDQFALKAISQKIQCNGFYVFSLDAEAGVFAHGRMFAPAIGIAEDPVTGNANGPLGAYLVHNYLAEHDGKSFQFKAKQGEAIGREGIIEVIVTIQGDQPEKVQIAGEATTVFKTHVTLT